MTTQSPQANIIRATGLIARGYSKLVLQPADITGGIIADANQ